MIFILQRSFVLYKAGSFFERNNKRTIFDKNSKIMQTRTEAKFTWIMSITAYLCTKMKTKNNKMRIYTLITMSAFALSTLTMSAQEPVIQTKYTADPAPMVYDGTVYLYTTHDEDDAEGFKMQDWLLYSSKDMVNWTDHGAVASLKDFKWIDKTNGAWAEQVIERNGKFYMYCPIHGNGIGVLVSDTPYGPFKDPLGHALVWQKEHWNDIDPTVWIDDDGQAYMYWGNPELYCVKLNEDMISYSGEIMKFPKIKDYQEGPWFYKRNSKYYLAFASTCCPEGIGYAMSDSPTGPWEYKGDIMAHTPRTRGNHPGIIEFKGQSYVFGLNYDILRIETPNHKERRSVSVAPMYYNEDGTIQLVPYFKDVKVEQVAAFDPFRMVPAATIAWGYGLKTRVPGSDNSHQSIAKGASKSMINSFVEELGKGQVITNVDADEYLLVRGVDFGKGAKKFFATASSTVDGSKIEVRIDSSDGQVIGTLDVANTGGKNNYQTFATDVNVKGQHDLYFVFKGAAKNNLLDFSSWQFK